MERGRQQKDRLREVAQPGTTLAEHLVVDLETLFLVVVERAIVARISGDRLRFAEEELRAQATCEALDIGAARLRAGDGRGAIAVFRRAEEIASEPLSP